MYLTRTIGIIALFAMTAAAPGSHHYTTTAGGDTTPAGTGGGALAEYGEDPAAADPALVAKALGPVEPSADDSWNIILAAIARADQDLDQATIDKALECWGAQSCDTGSGGDLVMGYADGGGDTVNVWRSVSHMEAILQALSYPEIGKIISTAADFNPDPEVPANDIRFLVQSGADFIVGYPDAGIALAGAVSEAEAAGVPYLSFSAGYVGLPGQEGALVPGEDYTSVIGEDLCALGKSFADVLNTGVGSGEVAMLGGTPGNALTLGWQQCAIGRARRRRRSRQPAGRREHDHGRHVLGEHDGAGRGSRAAHDEPGHPGMGLRVRRWALHRPPGV